MWIGLFTIALLTPATTQTSAVEQVEALLSAGDRAGAIRAFHAVESASPRAVELRTRINQAADELLDEVDKLLTAKNYPAAGDRLGELLTTMSGLPTGSLARQRLAEMCSKPEIQEQFKRREHERNGETALADARRLRDDGHAEDAYARFKSVAADFAGTPAGVAAADAVKAFDADPAFIRRLRDRAAESKARPVLNLAENYRSAGKVEMAMKKYREVIEQFPGTSFAETAQTELSRLK